MADAQEPTDVLKKAETDYTIDVKAETEKVSGVKSPGAQVANPVQPEESVHESSQAEPGLDRPDTNDFFHHDHDNINSTKINISNLLGLIEVVSVIPTHTPKYFFQQFKIYVNGATKRFYVYNYKTGSWLYTALT